MSAKSAGTSPHLDEDALSSIADRLEASTAEVERNLDEALSAANATIARLQARRAAAQEPSPRALAGKRTAARQRRGR